MTRSKAEKATKQTLKGQIRKVWVPEWTETGASYCLLDWSTDYYCSRRDDARKAANRANPKTTPNGERNHRPGP